MSIEENARRIVDGLPLEASVRLRQYSDRIVEIIISDRYKNSRSKEVEIARVRYMINGYITALYDCGHVELNDSLDLISYYETIRPNNQLKGVRYNG